MKLTKQQQDDLKFAIFKSGLKKVKIAEKMNISDGHLLNMLSGRDTITPDKLKKLNKILNTSV